MDKNNDFSYDDLTDQLVEIAKQKDALVKQNLPQDTFIQQSHELNEKMRGISRQRQAIKKT